MYDVVIIGAGVVGAHVARKLSEYHLKIGILEKENDVAEGATKANSAIVHAGYDAPEGTLKAALNVRGSEMMAEIAAQLDVPYRRNGSLVVGFDEGDRTVLEGLYRRGVANGVRDLRLIGRDELRTLEPNIADAAVCALYAPTGAIVCPYELAIAAIGNAMDNGAELRCGFMVGRIAVTDGGYAITAAGGETVRARYVVNAAGVYADQIAGMIGDKSFTVTPRRGEYILLDKAMGGMVSHTVFRTPGKMGKGILITPTVDGNLLTGPTSENIDDKQDRMTTAAGIAGIMRQTGETVRGLAFNQSITSFTGLRAVGSTGDFIIRAARPGFINVAGIESPGLSSAPAIALMVRDLLASEGLTLTSNPAYDPHRRSPRYFSTLSADEKNAMIKRDSRYGRIVCRCETVTEGEIAAAIRQHPQPHDLDGVKRRTRAQMGRCQGGFCSPTVAEMLAESLHIPFEDVTKRGGASVINIGRTKGDIGHD